MGADYDWSPLDDWGGDADVPDADWIEPDRGRDRAIPRQRRPTEDGYRPDAWQR
jgi:hypothetical protein